jgi:hypothetical protein
MVTVRSDQRSSRAVSQPLMRETKHNEQPLTGRFWTKNTLFGVYQTFCVRLFLSKLILCKCKFSLQFPSFSPRNHDFEQNMHVS